jgi:predicted nucleic acid-binding protein
MKIMDCVVSLFDTGAWVALAFLSHPFHSKVRAVFNGLIIQAGGVLQGDSD